MVSSIGARNTRRRFSGAGAAGTGVDGFGMSEFWRERYEVIVLIDESVRTKCWGSRATMGVRGIGACVADEAFNSARSDMAFDRSESCASWSHCSTASSCKMCTSALVGETFASTLAGSSVRLR